jgi:hypothetical protein
MNELRVVFVPVVRDRRVPENAWKNRAALSAAK